MRGCTQTNLGMALMVQSLGGLSRGSLQFRQVHAVITSIAQSHQTLNTHFLFSGMNRWGENPGLCLRATEGGSEEGTQRKENYLGLPRVGDVPGEVNMDIELIVMIIS